MNLSLCMIVRDEAATLPSCLQSVEGVVDDIVVVDTGSTDQTIEVARSFGARVYSFAWCDDFAAARNESLKYAKGDWILVLDADEVLVPEIVPVLKQVLQVPEHLVVNLLREEIGSNQVPYSLLSRLFRNRPEIVFAHPYHELIDDSVTAILEREPRWQMVEISAVAIRHTGYQAEAIAQRQKFERASTIMQRFLAEHPDDAYICNKLGALYVSSGKLTQGLALLERGLQLPSISPPILYELHYHLGDTYRQLQNPTASEKHYQAALEQPIQPKLKLGTYNNWGNMRLDLGDAAGARTLYEQAVEIDPTFAVGYFNLGMALKQLGNLTGAIAHYQQAIRLQPSYAEAHQNLGVALLRVGNVTDSLEAFRQAISLYEKCGSAEGDRLRQGLQEMGFLK